MFTTLQPESPGRALRPHRWAEHAGEVGEIKRLNQIARKSPGTTIRVEGGRKAQGNFDSPVSDQGRLVMKVSCLELSRSGGGEEL